MSQLTDQHVNDEPDNRVQQIAAFAVSVCWIGYLIYLLTLQQSPILGEWAGPPHLSSSVLLAIALSSVLSRFIPVNPLLGWWTIVASTSLIIGFECLQLLTPNRTFQFIDIAEGIAGSAIAAMIAVITIRVIGRSAYVWLAIAVAIIALIASLFLLRIEAPETEVSCNEPVNANLNWDLVLINYFDADPQRHNLVSTNIGNLCLFDIEPDKPLIDLSQATTHSTTDEHTLLLSGEGLLSAELSGLHQALSDSGEITFGIRFRANRLDAGRPPRFVASLQHRKTPRAIVARLLQNGPNATVSFSFQPWQGSSTVMANRLKDRYHEVVLTYDGTVQTSYFDGVPIGTEKTEIDAPDVLDSELILSLGKRVDRRWQPFIGEISAIVIGTKSLSADKVAKVFTNTDKE